MGWMARETIEAFPAGSKGDRDTIAGADPSDLGSNALNDPCAFMTEYRRKIQAKQSVTRGNIGMANATGDYSYQSFSRPWTVEFHILKQERSTRLTDHGGAGANRHCYSPE
jgi:hypothetical protein